jgi:DNA-binding IclR family transcriptional regulator
VSPRLHNTAATPVFDGTGACVAALSVSGPAYRMKPETLDELGRLCAAAAGSSPVGQR